MHDSGLAVMMAAIVMSVVAGAATGEVTCCVVGASVEYSPSEYHDIGGEEFGKSVVIQEDVLFVGEHARTVSGQAAAGEVHVYRWDETQEEWGYLGSIEAENPSSGDLFGHDIDVEGNFIIVGANGHDSLFGVPGSGKAEVTYFDVEFNQQDSTWQLVTGITTVLEPPVPPGHQPAGPDGSGEEFGHSVAIDGNFAIVTSHKYESGGTQPRYLGRAYVFGFDGTEWAHCDTILPPAELSGSGSPFGYEFGWSVAMDGEYAVIGAPGNPNPDGGTISEPGFAFVYKRDSSGNYERYGEALQATVTAEGVPDHFGKSVDIEDMRVAVGAPGPLQIGGSPVGAVPGSAYVFECDDSDTANVIWPCVSGQLKPCNLDEDLRMGWSISLDGDTLLVGARDRDLSPDAIAHLFRRNVNGGWDLVLGIDGVEGPSDTAEQSGWDVAIDGARVVMTDAGLSGGETAGGLPAVGAMYTSYLNDIATRPTCACPADLSLDGTIDMDDVTLLLGLWGECPGWSTEAGCEQCTGDLDCDGVISDTDLIAMFDAYGPCDDQGSGTPPASVVDCLAQYTECPRLCSCIEAVLIVNTP